MDDSVDSVITAISDQRLEGSITASLHRIGLKVICRATSLEALKSAVDGNPRALVISSPDFRDLREIPISHHISLGATASSLSDGELRDLLRSIDEPTFARARVLKQIAARIFIVASSGRTVGASTLALNMAEVLSHKGLATLLLDCNEWNPYLSRQLGINGLHRKITRTAFGFSVGEIVSNSALDHFAHSLDSFNEIVIDYGQLNNPAELLKGRRMREEIFTWAMHSDATLYLVSRSEPRALEDLARLVEQLRISFPALDLQVLLVLTKVLSGRERTRLIERTSKLLGVETTLISRDRQAIEAMEEQGATLSACATKSPVLRELHELISEPS